MRKYHIPPEMLSEMSTNAQPEKGKQTSVHKINIKLKVPKYQHRVTIKTTFFMFLNGYHKFYLR